MTFAAALLSIFLASLPGNIIDMYHAAVLAASSRRVALRIASVTSLFACPVLIVLILFNAWSRMAEVSDRGWAVFVISLWAIICAYLLYGAYRDFVLVRKD